MKKPFLISLASVLVILTFVVYVLTHVEKPEPQVTQPIPSTTQPAVTPAPPEPTPIPTPTQPVTDPDLLLIPLEDLPGYAPGTRHSDGSWSKDMGLAGLMRYWFFQGNTMMRDLDAREPIAFGTDDTYTSIEGVLTFRGNHNRNAPTWGTADVLNEKLEIVWTHDIGAISGHGSYWPGTGWTGQPLLVRWPEETRQVMGLFPEMKEKDLVEVIYPAFDGNIYFLDLETGEPTRDPIHVGFGMKGTGTVDPRGYPLFYTGQGLNDTNGRTGAFFYRMFDLIENKENYPNTRTDPVAFRFLGSLDL